MLPIVVLVIEDNGFWKDNDIPLLIEETADFYIYLFYNNNQQGHQYQLLIINCTLGISNTIQKQDVRARDEEQ